jgi:hypothetical protein
VYISVTFSKGVKAAVTEKMYSGEELTMSPSLKNVYDRHEEKY